MSRRATLLICDDEAVARRGAARALGRARYELVESEDGRACLAALAERPVDLVLLDLLMPVMDGLTTLAAIRQLPSPPPVVVLTADSSLRLAIEAMKAGAEDYLAKPYDIDELRLVVERTLESAGLKRENRRLRAELARAGGSGALVGESEPMRRVFEVIERVAPTSAGVLITGETGTGKELAARRIHELSEVADGPFVVMNCAAVPETLVESELFGHRRGAFTGADRDRVGRFQEADRGTLFLDEIGDMPLGAQAKLLRVLQDGLVEPLGGGRTLSVSVRVLAATHRDLKQRVEEGTFREDLLYRLRVVVLELPPLRARGNDVALLARQLLVDLGRGPLELSEETERALLSHAWPGNVRELRNAMERAAIFCRDGVVKPGDLPVDVCGPRPEGSEAGAGLLAWEPGDDFATAKRKLIERFERCMLERALSDAGGNISQAARALGLHRQNLQQKMKELGLR